MHYSVVSIEFSPLIQVRSYKMQKKLLLKIFKQKAGPFPIQKQEQINIGDKTTSNFQN